jgi:CubicO group peptidase (beta-lactamase class C family)
MISRRLAAAFGAAVLGIALSPTARAQAPAAETPILAPAAPESAGFSGAKLTALNDAMHQAVDQGEVAGITTMLVRHGKVVNFDAYGKKSLATGEPLTRDAIFRMYSQTKPLTAAAMMILFEQGKWKLDEPITDFIPEFSKLKVMTGLDAKGQPILADTTHPPTMRELMTHSAGFGYGLRSDDYVDQQFQSQGVLRSNGLQAMVEKIANIPLLYQPGTKWSYSAAVDIQGYIVQKLSGQSFGDFLQTHLFRPLGMHDTGFMVPADKASRLAAVYVKSAQTNNKLFELTPQLSPLIQDFTKAPALESGGGGSVSTIDDYARFCQMILNGGELDGVRVLSPASVKMMETDALETTVVPEATPTGRPGIGGDALGFGMDMLVFKDPAKAGSPVGVGTITWGGAAGTWFWIDPKNDLFFLGMIQRFGTGNAGYEKLITPSQTLVYSALVDPTK